jgi:hypothetical protein
LTLADEGKPWEEIRNWSKMGVYVWRLMMVSNSLTITKCGVSYGSVVRCHSHVKLLIRCRYTVLCTYTIALRRRSSVFRVPCAFFIIQQKMNFVKEEFYCNIEQSNSECRDIF